MKERWIHYKPDVTVSTVISSKYTTLCGKTALRIKTTKDPNIVTCPRCIDDLKVKRYWCMDHGFLSDVDVTFDEKCDYCGNSI